MCHGSTKVESKVAHAPQKDAFRLFNAPQKHPKCIHTENIIACYDIMSMWKPKPSKGWFFFFSAVHVKLLPRVSHDLADKKNCI